MISSYEEEKKREETANEMKNHQQMKSLVLMRNNINSCINLHFAVLPDEFLIMSIIRLKNINHSLSF